MSSSRFVLSIALLTAVLVAAVLGMDHVLGHAVSQSESLAAGRLARLQQHREPDEIPIFGASKAGADYVPSVLGPRFYNYGLEGASLDVTCILLRTALERPSRQPIVIDLTQWSFPGAGDPRNYLLITQNSEIRVMLQRAGVWQWYYGVPGLRFFGAWDWFAKGLLTDRFTVTKQYVRGYEVKLNEAPWSPDLFARAVEKRRAVQMHWGIDPQQETRLLGLIDSAPQRQFVIVLSPLHEAFFHNATGEARFRQELARMMRQAPNLQIIDMTRAGYPDTLFLDTSHLKREGARSFSTELRKELERRRILPAA